MEPSDRQLQLIITATVTAAVFVAGYIIVTERNKALSERELTVWIHDNRLDEFYEHFYLSGKPIYIYFYVCFICGIFAMYLEQLFTQTRDRVQA